MVKAYEEGFKMDGVTETLRFVKFRKKTSEGKYSQVLVVTTDFDIPLLCPSYKCYRSNITPNAYGK